MFVISILFIGLLSFALIYRYAVKLIKFDHKRASKSIKLTLPFGDSVLVHSGGVHGGHYYAFIRPTLSDQWYSSIYHTFQDV